MHMPFFPCLLPLTQTYKHTKMPGKHVEALSIEHLLVGYTVVIIWMLNIYISRHESVNIFI